MLAMMNEHFGSCTNFGEGDAVCPKKIPLEFIAKMNRDLIGATWHRRREPLLRPGVVQQPSHEDAGTEASGPEALALAQKITPRYLQLGKDG